MMKRRLRLDQLLYGSGMAENIVFAWNVAKAMSTKDGGFPKL